MTWLVNARNRLGVVLVAAARTSQAVVIETLDRAVGVSERRAWQCLRRAGRVPLEVAGMMLDDPAQFVDDGYALLQGLTSLHREFAQRLFEVLDYQEPSVVTAFDVETGDVLPFVAWRAHPLTH